MSLTLGKRDPQGRFLRRLIRVRRRPEDALRTVERPQGVGLTVRAARLSGQLDVTSGGGRGTRITLDIPTESACSAG